MYFFKKNLEYLLKKNNLNKNQLSIKLDITRQSINEYFSRDKLPSIDTLVKIRTIFNVSIDDLLLKDLEAEETKK